MVEEGQGRGGSYFFLLLDFHCQHRFFLVRLLLNDQSALPLYHACVYNKQVLITALTSIIRSGLEDEFSDAAEYRESSPRQGRIQNTILRPW